MSFLNNVFNFLASGQYTSSPSPITPGSSGPLLCDQYGRLIVITNDAGSPVLAGTSWVDPAAGTPLAASAVVAAGPKNLFQCFGTNAGASARWLMIFNASAVPADTTQPALAFLIPAGAPFSLDLRRPRFFGVGICWAASSTAGTLTGDTGALINLNFEVA